MLDAGVIVPVTEPTPWINSFVIVETTDQHGNPKMRICLDPTPLNKEVIREPYHYRSPDDIYHHLCNAKYLTVIDFKKCYWQCLLDEENSYLTTFNTPYGRFRFVRLPFGVNVSGDAVQRKTDEIYVVPPQSWGDRSDTKHSKCLLLGGRRLNQLTLIPKPKGSGGARAATAQVGPANKRNDTKRCLPVEASLRPGEAVPW